MGRIFLRLVAGLSPFGPIFGKELRTTARRKRSYLLRVGYLGLLLLALLVAYAEQGRSYGGLAARAQQQAELGALFFAVFSMFCIVTMGLIGPVLTSTAVGSERLAKTLPVLLMTPITTWQIISGKLFSRLLAALTLIGLSLPVLALVRLLGGVELGQMIAVVCLCTTFVLSCAAIGLFYSSLMNRAYAVILLSYVTLGVVYALAPFLIVAGVQMSERRSIRLFEYAHPVFATMIQCMPRGLMRFGGQWWWCCAVQLGLTAVLVWASTIVLRRSARKAGGQATATGGSGEEGERGRQGEGETGQARRVVGYAQPGTGAPGAGLTRAGGPFRVMGWFFGAGPLVNRGRVRDVSDSPVLWREVSRPLMARPWQRIVMTSVCFVLLLLVYAVLGGNRDLDDPDLQIGFAIIFAGLIWLLTAVLSATAIASEKESDTWTLLLTTPVTGMQVVWGKVAGLYRRMLWPLLLVTAHLLLFTVTGVIHVMSIPLVLWVILTFNSVWVATGLYLSLRMKRATFAVIANLMLAVVVYFVPMVLLSVFGQLTREWSLVQHAFWHIPYFFVGAGMSALNSRWSREFALPGRGGYRNGVSGDEFGLVVFLLGCLHLLVAGLILSRLAANFDAVVGRAGRRAHAGAFETDEAVIAVKDISIAPVWRRLVALVLDGLLLRVGGAMLGALAGFIAVVSQTEYDPFRRPDEMMAQYTAWGVALSVAAAWPYYALFESSRRRATPGKAAMGLFVADADGRRVSFLRASGRYFATLASGLTLGMGYLLALFDPSRRTLHDRWAGTIVIAR